MREVHIVGKGPGWDLAPPDGEIWGVNDLLAWREGVKLNFYMDRWWHLLPEHYDKYSIMSETIKEECNKQGTPIFCTVAYDDMPSSMAFPLEDLKDFFSLNNGGTLDYFGNSIDYMLAYAIYQGYDHIHTYGVNMCYGTEYVWEKPATTFWVGLALGLGLTVSIHGSKSELLKTGDGKLYAYGNTQEMSRLNMRLNMHPYTIRAIMQGSRTLSFSTVERLIIPSLLPGTASYADLKAVRDFKKTIGFSEDEAKALKLRSSKDRDDTFEFDVLADKQVEYDVPENICAMIAKRLIEKDKSGTLTDSYLKLYEMFVVGDN